MCWSCIFGKGSAIMRGGQKKSLSPSCPLTSPPAPGLPSRSGAPFARRARNYFHFSFLSFIAPLLPPPFPSSPLPLTLSAPQLSDTSVLQEVKWDIIKTRLPLF